MTTLTATVSDSFACLLSESQLSDDEKYLKITCDKVFQSGSWIFSGSGWNRPHDVLAFQMKWPEPSKTIVNQNKLLPWIVKNLVPKIISVLRLNNAIDIDKGTALSDSEFLIATHGKVFLIDAGFGVTPIEDFFISGSGGKLALGALSGFKQLVPDKWQQDHDQLSKIAIEQAIKFDLYSSGVVKGYRSYPSGKVEPVDFK
jgi:hypothetical protein